MTNTPSHSEHSQLHPSTYRLLLPTADTKFGVGETVQTVVYGEIVEALVRDIDLNSDPMVYLLQLRDGFEFEAPESDLCPPYRPVVTAYHDLPLDTAFSASQALGWGANYLRMATKDSPGSFAGSIHIPSEEFDIYDLTNADQKHDPMKACFELAERWESISQHMTSPEQKWRHPKPLEDTHKIQHGFALASAYRQLVESALSAILDNAASNQTLGAEIAFPTDTHLTSVTVWNIGDQGKIDPDMMTERLTEHFRRLPVQKCWSVDVGISQGRPRITVDRMSLRSPSIERGSILSTMKAMGHKSLQGLSFDL